MISFAKKAVDAKPASPKAEDNRFEQIRKKAAEGHKKSATAGGRAPETPEDKA